MMIFKRDALNERLSKIKSRFPKGFKQLAIISFISLSLLGYYPNLGIPPVKKSLVLASHQEQKEEIVAESFSKPPVLPHPGYLTTRFSTRHPSIDIAAGLGMPIHPIIDGEVTKVGRDFWGLGNYVVVAHQNGFKSKYAHMSKIYVKVKDEVTPENILGEVGLTGNTSGPHTHLEIIHNEEYIDPETLLPEISNMP